MRQTCTGTKKKTSQSTWEGATIPLKFLFFLSLCRFGALWSSFFLSLCRSGALWSSKLVFFLSLCRFDALWSSKPDAFVHFYFDIVSIACRYSWHIWHFLLPMQLFEGSGAFIMQRVYNLKKNWSFSGPDSGFRKLEFSSFWNVSKLKVICIQNAFLLVFAVFLNMWSYWLYSYLVWWPPLQELESALGGRVPIYIYICISILYTNGVDSSLLFPLGEFLESEILQLGCNPMLVSS